MSSSINELVGNGSPTDIASIILDKQRYSNRFIFDEVKFSIDLPNVHMILYIILNVMSCPTKYIELVIWRSTYKFNDELVNSRLETLLVLNTNLHTLRITKCQHINSDGLKYLCQGLKSNTTLRCLDLSYTRFKDNYNDRAVRTLCETLYNNTSITSLNITGCAKIYDMYYLPILIGSNTTLTHLSFSISKSHPPNLDSFIEMLKVNYTLLHIHIENIDKFPGWKSSIDRYLERNRKLL